MKDEYKKRQKDEQEEKATQGKQYQITKNVKNILYQEDPSRM
jgi:hypothetical protein